ncbi:non-canonical purine NTP pyrophosphatase [Lentilactobacillus parabuchneri]
MIESEKTFAENALTKTRTFSYLQIPTTAEDSGLMVDVFMVVQLG